VSPAGDSSETPGAAGRRAIFLDRDGVLNRAKVVDGKPLPPSSVDELELLPGVEQACRQLHEAGLLLIVVSNQPDIARGTQTMATVEALNRELSSRLPLDEIRVCPHNDADRCLCRKPAPGLLLDAAQDWGIELENSVMVGDRWRDVEAGRRAGCKTVFIDSGYSERPPEAPDLTARGLGEAVPWILERSAEGRSDRAHSR
jgi:D-glycero-D-manno-heptose 1,7-bisphosphate phosphatase